MGSPPTVTAVMAAYDYGHFIAEALESALGQDYPPESLDVVVVDDGSTDDTREVVSAVAQRHPGRITYLWQQNQGYVAANNRAFAAARGELIAILDADDAWQPGKIAAQAALMAERPGVGLVFGDLCFVDAAGAVTERSFWRSRGVCPERGRPVARLLQENFITASTIVVRASLRDRFAPVPPGIAYVDWWLAVRAAQCMGVDFIGEVCMRYRMHGGNLTTGATGERRIRETRKNLEFRRWFLARAPESALTPAEGAELVRRMDDDARAILAEAGTPFTVLAAVDAGQTHAAAAALARGRELAEAGRVQEAGWAFQSAVGHDPFNAPAREALADLAAEAPSGDPPAGAGAALPFDLRPRVVVVNGADVVGDPGLVALFLRDHGRREDVTLAVPFRPDLDGPPEEGVAVLEALLDPASDRLDLLVLPGCDAATEASLLARAHVRLASGRPVRAGTPPVVGEGGLPALEGVLAAPAGGGAAPTSPDRVH